MSDDMSTSSPPKVPWSLRDMVAAGITAIILFGLGVGLLAGAMIAWQMADRLEPPPSVQALAVFSLEAILILPAWLWGPGRYGGGWRILGLRRSLSWGMVEAALLGLIVVLAINAAWEMVNRYLDLPGQPDVLSFFGGGLGGLCLALLLGGGVAPLAEEIFFRGYLYAGLRARWGAGWGMILSAILFSVVHVFPGVLPPIFVMGLLFAWLYERYDSLWPCILLHSAVNSLAFLFVYLAERFPQLLGS
ncbi:MAG: CPBP family intramembrane metalloprotease [Chloroflexi bacterium]|nr:CPBP family intramembrane metalloprotease [Chloroflexota bacterium]